MAYESFELVGTVTTLEQKKKQDGTLIPGFWTVKLQTAQGERTCSFNSVRRIVAKDPDSDMEPHPDFPVIQQAQATGETVRITGYLTQKNEKTFKNGTAAEIVAAGTKSTWTEPAKSNGGGTPQASPQPGITQTSGLSIDEERAWRALAIVVPQLEFEQPSAEEQVEWTREKALKLVNLAQQIAGHQTSDWGSPG